jgi:hypothetical protein
VLTINGTSFSLNLAKMIIRRNLNPAGGSALTTVDFGASEAFGHAPSMAESMQLGRRLGLDGRPSDVNVFTRDRYHQGRGPPCRRFRRDSLARAQW